MAFHFLFLFFLKEVEGILIFQRGCWMGDTKAVVLNLGSTLVSPGENSWGRKHTFIFTNF